MSFASEVILKLKEIKSDVFQLENEKKELETDIANRKLLSVDLRRSLHWVIKIGNLKKSVEFYSNVFGMKVLRHEEFDKGCEAKCNGDFSRPWSKTMIGYGDEKKQFALELTYNYGIKGYERGNDLRFIGLHLTKNGFKAAQEMAYQIKQCDDGKMFYDVIGPNNITYRCKMSEKLPREPFWSIALNVSNVEKSFKYYCGVLNLCPLSFIVGKYLRAAYGGRGQVPFEFYQLNEEEILNHGAAGGRIAFSTSIESGPYVIYDYITRYNKEWVMTKPVTLETRGKADVDVVILRDVDQYEICFVNATGFNDLCTTRPGDENIDWSKRAEKGADRDKGKIIIKQ